ncbi:unnamed protein product [Fusarium venenatum]|uniref:Uncharacterized protein n=1 Tax=Fusarium venenatum TaxID=56646 RepID=A0A2L2T190_9HYPO|nr:uncharacterized protein FVRRES_07754 [Fusarium venenatum]CEI63318.1 unnamed protein product [Fusarium venenatum]
MPESVSFGIWAAMSVWLGISVDFPAFKASNEPGDAKLCPLNRFRYLNQLVRREATPIKYNNKAGHIGFNKGKCAGYIAGAGSPNYVVVYIYMYR